MLKVKQMGKILNVGVVGLGRIGRNHLSELSSFPERFKIVAGADHDPERLNELCPEKLKDAAKYASLDEMLKYPGLDMVTIGTRHPAEEAFRFCCLDPSAVIWKKEIHMILLFCKIKDFLKKKQRIFFL